MLSYVLSTASGYVLPPSPPPVEPLGVAKYSRVQSKDPFAPLHLSSDSDACSEHEQHPSGSDTCRECRPPSSPNPEKYSVIQHVLSSRDLYDVLGVPKDADASALRRAYMTRCKACHPDKFPEYPLAHPAFQKVSFAYDTLRNPNTRRSYDARKEPLANPTFSSQCADDTLNSVLYGVFCDFMDGDLETIRTFLLAVNDISPTANLSEETIDSLLGTFRKLREVLLTGQKYVRVVRFELIRLYEIQHSLRQLSYLDVFGRLRLTLQLVRLTLSLPCAIDQAMQAEAEEERRRTGNGQVEAARRKSILPKHINTLILTVCGLLEFGEKVL